MPNMYRCCTSPSWLGLFCVEKGWLRGACQGTVSLLSQEKSGILGGVSQAVFTSVHKWVVAEEHMWQWKHSGGSLWSTQSRAICRHCLDHFTSKQVTTRTLQREISSGVLSGGVINDENKHVDTICANLILPNVISSTDV